jgi:hypothetical protein
VRICQGEVIEIDLTVLGIGGKKGQKGKKQITNQANIKSIIKTVIFFGSGGV